MTERFSPEYIAYILSDEAKVLQEQWKVGAGDWYTFLGANKAYLLDYPLDPRLGGVDDDVRWLPTLSDLLGMIEEAGWAWEKRLDGTVEAHREIGYHEEYDQYEYESTGNIYGGGIMRTFAKLAVRVLEGK